MNIPWSPNTMSREKSSVCYAFYTSIVLQFNQSFHSDVDEYIGTGAFKFLRFNTTAREYG